MKKIHLLLSSLLLLTASCGSVKPQYIESVGILDYDVYSSHGFFITESNSVSFPYTPVGSVVASVYSGEGDEWHYSNGVMRNSKGIADPVKGLQLAVEAAKNKGANAIINLKIAPSTINYTGQSGFVVTGMAIKKE